MNKQQLIDTLTTQVGTPSISIDNLESLLKKYPYFQTAYLLLTRQAIAFHHPDFSYILTKAATHVSDRSVLYALYHKLKKTTQLPPLSASPKTEVQSQESLVETTEKTTQEEVSQEPLTIQESLSNQIEETTSLHDQFLKEKTDENVPTTPIDTVDVTLLKKKLEEDNSLDKEEVLEQQEEHINTTFLETKEDTPTSDLSELIQKEVQEMMAQKTKEQQDKEVQKEETAEEDWKATIEKDKELLDQPQTEDISFMNTEDKDEDAVLENLSISKQKEVTGMDTDSVMSETMAKVYIRQGFYQQAINIYKELIEKYPEKKLYFAGKIEELTNKL